MSERTVVLKIPDGVDVSDGFHTFTELYEHRCRLWIAVCRLAKTSWKTLLHSDGTSFEGWFVLGIGEAAGEQMTYHLPIRMLGDVDFARTLERAPTYDGHSSADVLERIKRLWVVQDETASPLRVGMVEHG